MWIANAWYIAAWSTDVGEGSLFARTILGEPVVFYRTAGGGLTALEDRCCHRHAPLSKGRLEGEELRCMYHGFKFAADGRCTFVPGETRVPKKYGVRHFPVVEKLNLIWIWMGAPELADPATIVDWPYLDDPAWPYKGGYLHYKASYRLGVDNFLDFSHLPYVHETTLGTNAYADQRPRIEPTPFGIRIVNLANDVPLAPIFQRFASFPGNVDRWSNYDFHILGNVLLGDFGSAPVGTGGHLGPREGAIQFRHLSCMTPETETTSHYHFAQTRNFGLDVPGLDDKVLASTVEAFEEDRAIIEAQQRVIDLDPTRPMLPAGIDKALLHIRRETDRIVEREQGRTAAAAE